MIQYPFDKLPAVTSPFGWRVHPVQKTKKHHNGVDLVAAPGSWVEASARGRVIFAGPSKRKLANGEPGGFGYHVMVRYQIHGEWVVMVYAHMRKGSIAVKVGQVVMPGTPLGKQGATGEVTGEHLHWEVCKGKTYRWTGDGSGFYDPIEFIKHARHKDALIKKAKAATDKDDVVHPIPNHDIHGAGAGNKAS